MNHNLYDLIASRTVNSGAFLLDANGATLLNYNDMHRLSAAYAAMLTGEYKLHKGDRVLVQVEKSADNLLLYLGCLRAGLIYLPLNTAYLQQEVDYFIGDAEPSLIVCDPAKAGMYSHGRTLPVLTLDAAGNGSLVTRLADADFGTATCDKDDIACILYTSGTTGSPKGAMITHGNLAANGLALRDIWGFEPDDVLLHALPIFHVHGLFVAANVAMLNGGPMMFHTRFDPNDVIKGLERATVFMGVPTHYTRMLGSLGLTREACANMRLFTSGSAPLLEQTFLDFEARTGHRILERYGMTETGINTSNPLNALRKPGTVGLPVPGVEARVVDDQGEACTAGTTGQLLVRGSNVFSGYWRKPEKTKEEFTSDGFFRTGDLAFVDEDGYISIVGRNKDLIITGGFNVYPIEVETVLDKHPGVAESAVIGLPDNDFGEAVSAVIVRSNGTDVDAETLVTYQKANLAGFKVARQIFFIDELPRNTMGKVQKNILRGQFT